MENASIKGISIWFVLIVSLILSTMLFWSFESDEAVRLSVENAVESNQMEFYSSDTGIIQINGTGNTNNEDLDFDFETTANTVDVSSDTGVTDIALDDIGYDIPLDNSVYDDLPILRDCIKEKSSRHGISLDDIVLCVDKIK